MHKRSPIKIVQNVLHIGELEHASSNSNSRNVVNRNSENSLLAFCKFTGQVIQMIQYRDTELWERGGRQFYYTHNILANYFQVPLYRIQVLILTLDNVIISDEIFIINTTICCII